MSKLLSDQESKTESIATAETSLPIICPITKFYIREPLQFLEDSKIYEREALEAYLVLQGKIVAECTRPLPSLQQDIHEYFESTSMKQPAESSSSETDVQEHELYLPLDTLIKFHQLVNSTVLNMSEEHKSQIMGQFKRLLSDVPVLLKYTGKECFSKFNYQETIQIEKLKAFVKDLESKEESDGKKISKLGEQQSLERARQLRNLTYKLKLIEELKKDARTGYQKVCENGALDIVNYSLGIILAPFNPTSTPLASFKVTKEIGDYIYSNYIRQESAASWCPSALNHQFMRQVLDARDREAAQKFIYLGAKVNATNQKQETVLHKLVDRLDAGMVEFLLYRLDTCGQVFNLSVQDKVEKSSPLHLIYNRADQLEDDTITLRIFSAFLKYGLTNQDKISPLDMFHTQNLDGNTIFHLLAEHSTPAELVLLLDYYRNQFYMSRLPISKYGLNIQNNNNESPLHIAVEERQHIDMLQLMLENGCNPLILDKNDETAFHRACGIMGKKDHSDTYERSDLAFPEEEEENELPERIGQILLKYERSSLVSINKSGFNVLHMLASNGSLNLLRYILRNHFDRVRHLLDAQTVQGDTALHIAAQKGRVEVIQILLSAGANPGIYNNDMVTPMFAALMEDYDLAALALNAKLLQLSP